MCDEKANAIADVFENSHKITLNSSSPLGLIVKKYIQSLRNISINDSQVTLTNVNEVKSFVFTLKNNKAPGLDGINSLTLKNSK